MKVKEYAITILATVVMTLGLLYSFDYINSDKSEMISELEIKIEDLQSEVAKYKDDKAFYKQLYIDLAEEYGNATNTIILTDTSR